MEFKFNVKYIRAGWKRIRKETVKGECVDFRENLQK